jgi:hypothetical protein
MRMILHKLGRSRKGSLSAPVYTIRIECAGRIRTGHATVRTRQGHAIQTHEPWLDLLLCRHLNEARIILQTVADFHHKRPVHLPLVLDFASMRAPNHRRKTVFQTV